MKPVQIDFVSSRRWQSVWAAAALCVLGVGGTAGWRAGQLNAAMETLDTRLSSTKLLLQRQRVPVNTNPGHASASHAARLLQLDLNTVFAAVENLKEPGVRLRSMQLDAAANTLRLEYELDSVAKASAITALLNDGDDMRPWQLESVVATGAPQFGFVQTSQTVRGIWSVPLDKL